jgi:hypothetical protein
MIRQNIRNYTFSNNDMLFFDANIWLYIYGPLVNPQNVGISATYATALQKIRQFQSRLFICVSLFVLSMQLASVILLEKNPMLKLWSPKSLLGLPKRIS